MRNKLIFYAASLATAAGIYLVLRFIFPKNAEMLPFFMIFLLLDIYLWTSVRRFFYSWKRTTRLIVTTLFWLPFVMLLFFLVLLMTKPLIYVDISFRTWWLGFIMTFYAAKVFPILFLIISDILRGLVFLVLLVSGKFRENKREVRRNRILIISGWSLGVMFFLVLVTGMVFWVHSFRVIRQDIILPELPPAFEGTTIAQISDIHLGSWTSKNQLVRAIKMVNDLHADYIFVTGDLANFATSDVLPFRNELSMLKAKEKIFVIMGNHDYGDYTTWPSDSAKMADREKLYRLYDSLQWISLLNQHYIAKKGNDSIAIIGVHNWGMTRRFQRLGDLDKAQKGVESMQVQLLLSHDPTHWENIVIRNHQHIDVTFSGHTHAMQIGFRLFGKEYSPAAFIYKEWGGLYEHKLVNNHPQYIYVNRGLGTIGYPGRVGELPEITFFTLKSRK